LELSGTLLKNGLWHQVAIKILLQIATTQIFMLKLANVFEKIQIAEREFSLSAIFFNNLNRFKNFSKSLFSGSSVPDFLIISGAYYKNICRLNFNHKKV